MDITIGIDPGHTGAIAAVHHEILLWVCDMPTIAGELSPNLLSQLWNPTEYGPFELHSEHPVAIERVHSMPRQGVASTFTFGESYGLVRGYFAARGHRITRITPTTWKGTFGLNGKDKDAARLKALELWPANADLFKRKKDIGRADAALIALHHARTRPATPQLDVDGYQSQVRQLRAVTNGWAEA